jgi:PAS domain S-box-containing protein
MVRSICPGPWDDALAEKATRECDASLLFTADDAPTLIWMTDGIGRLVYVNRRFDEISGGQAQRLRGDGWRAIVLPEDLHRFRTSFRSAFARREPFRAELRVLTAEGAIRWHRCEAIPRSRTDGSLIGYVGCNVDITEAKEAEAALRELNATLECRVAERTAQLAAGAAARAAAQERLRHTQKLEALGQLAGGVAHDFNNASASVLAGIALLEKRHGDVLAAAGTDVQRLLAGLREAAERGALISRRLLAFGRREELRAADLDPSELLRGLRAVLANALGPAVQVVVDAPAGLPPLRADQAQLETTLINLAVNARDAMPNGGTVTLGASAEQLAPAPTRPSTHARTSLAPGQYLRLWVADTGTGMDAMTLARAAEPFFTTKPRDKGTGLGLSMAYGFAAQSGGAMQIDSAPGRGTTITLWLPRAADKGVPSGSIPDQASRLRALVVEDQPMMRRFLAECLKHEGWEVREVEDAGQALAQLDAGEPCDLLLTDLAMPGMDGMALIQAARIKRPDLAALLLTGTGRVADVAPLAAHYGFALLRKPVSPAELAECVLGLVTVAPREAPHAPLDPTRPLVDHSTWRRRRLS